MRSTNTDTDHRASGSAQLLSGRIHLARYGPVPSLCYAAMPPSAYPRIGQRPHRVARVVQQWLVLPLRQSFLFQQGSDWRRRDPLFTVRRSSFTVTCSKPTSEEKFQVPRQYPARYEPISASISLICSNAWACCLTLIDPSSFQGVY